jgi:SAM-dependent methyltransferase
VVQPSGTIVNTEQFAAWNGYEGRHWAAHQDRWDAVNREVNDRLFAAAAIGAADDVLDVGCGAGQSTRLAAARAPRGRVLGIDLSAPMLARARATTTAQGLANVAFAQGDAQVYPFPPGRFDVALSRFGVMFFADPVAAFANIGRALKPGGRLAFVCMQDLSRSDLGAVFGALAGQVPAKEDDAGEGTPDAPGMFSLADPARIAAVLAGAGFRAASPTPVDFPMVFGQDAATAAAFLLGTGPVHDLLESADQATRDGVLATLTTTLRRYQGPDGVRLRGAAWLVSATRREGRRRRDSRRPSSDPVAAAGLRTHDSGGQRP